MGRYKALPKDGKAATLWSNRDQAYENIVDGIRRVLKLVAAADSEERAPKASKRASRGTSPPRVPPKTSARAAAKPRATSKPSRTSARTKASPGLPGAGSMKKPTKKTGPKAGAPSRTNKRARRPKPAGVR